MTNIEIAVKLKDLVIEAEDIITVRRLALLAMDLYNKESQPKATPKQAAPKPAPEPKKKKKVDHGKICACYKAGWSIAKIADEESCTTAAVRMHLKQEGLIK